MGRYFHDGTRFQRCGSNVINPRKLQKVSAINDLSPLKPPTQPNLLCCSLSREFLFYYSMLQQKMYKATFNAFLLRVQEGRL